MEFEGSDTEENGVIICLGSTTQVKLAAALGNAGECGDDTPQIAGLSFAVNRENGPVN